MHWLEYYPVANLPVQLARVDLFTKRITTLRIDSAQHYMAGLMVPTHYPMGNAPLLFKRQLQVDSQPYKY